MPKFFILRFTFFIYYYVSGQSNQTSVQNLQAHKLLEPQKQAES